MKQFKFDSVMFPINFVEYYTHGFGKEVLALANEQGAGVLAIKPLSWGAWQKDAVKDREWWYRSTEEPKTVSLAVRFSLSQPGVVSCIPTSFVELLDKAIEAAKSYTPLDDSAVAELKRMAENRGSIFEAEEKQVALNLPHRMPGCPYSPHEEV
jgi:predicted aldo/keto reductase-like oxidoreductase